ncbi:E3 ubiquitin protein ligase DRIP2, partial [Linum perenne]
MMKKVERKKLAACMTCPLCHNLFRRPTTISECLHTCNFILPFPNPYLSYFFFTSDFSDISKK